MAGGPLLLSRIDRGAWQFAAMTFLFGAALGLAVGFGAVALSNPDSDSHVRTVVDFHFQMLNISTPRQADKLMNIFVKWRYPPGTDRCPFHPTDNHCIQYQHAPMEWIRNVTQSEQEGLVLGAEWERVASVGVHPGIMIDNFSCVYAAVCVCVCVCAPRQEA